MAYPPANLVDAVTGGIIEAATINALDAGVQDIVTELGVDPSGTSATVQARLDAVTKNYKFSKISSGDIALAATGTWVPIVTTTWDLTIAAKVGDVLEASLYFRVGTAAGAFQVFDVATVVGGAPVNSTATSAAFPATAVGSGLGSTAGNTVDAGRGGAVLHTVVAGDLANGLVMVRPYHRQAGAATAGTLYASAANGVAQFSVKNLGPTAT